VDDSADLVGRNVTLSGNGATSTITGLTPAPINYPTTHTSAFTLKGGNGSDTFTITGPQAVLLGTTLYTGGGTDTVNVQASGNPLTINSAVGSGPDVINLGDASNSLSGITGPVTVQAGSADKLAFNDQGTSVARTYTIGAGSVSWGPTVNYTGVGTLNFNGGTGPDTFALKGTSATAALFANGGGTQNTVTGSNASNIWALTGTNAGSLYGPAYLSPASFTNMQNITAGTADDYYLFADGASIIGNLIGGGHSTLDYRNYSTSVIVDLQLALPGIDTGVGGIVSGVSEVFGGTVAPAGPGVYNLLIGDGGSYLVGGTGRRNILVAGGSPSYLFGGDDEDLLITGTTIYDTEASLANWKAIASYWASFDDFATRSSNLLDGIGVPLLDATTVTGNGSGNTLKGNGGELLLYSDGFDAAVDFLFAQLVPILP
jgi:hypothetical protein